MGYAVRILCQLHLNTCCLEKTASQRPGITHNKGLCEQETCSWPLDEHAMRHLELKRINLPTQIRSDAQLLRQGCSESYNVMPAQYQDMSKQSCMVLRLELESQDTVPLSCFTAGEPFHLLCWATSEAILKPTTLQE